MSIKATMRIIVLHGPEDFLRSEYLRHAEAALEKAHGGFERFDFDGASTDIAHVLDELRSYGLMQTHKLVVVDAADQLLSGGDGSKSSNSPRQLMERYAQNPVEHAMLILRSTRWNRGKLDKMIDAVGTIIKCQEPAPQQAAAWCVERARKRLDATMQRDAAMLLVERIGTDLARLDSELGKLAAAAKGEPPELDRDLVIEMVGRSREEEAWELQSAILGGGAKGALRVLRDLRNVSRISEVLIIWSMLDLARKVHEAAQLLAAGQPPRSAAREVGLWGPSEGPVLKAAGTLGPSRSGKVLHEVMEAAEALRSGRAGGPDRTLEAIAVRMADTVS